MLTLETIHFFFLDLIFLILFSLFSFVIFAVCRYMNLVLDDAAEIDTKTGTKREVGMILLKGDTITLIQVAGGAQ